MPVSSAEYFFVLTKSLLFVKIRAFSGRAIIAKSKKIKGTKSDDNIQGTGGVDKIDARHGDDVVHAGGGSDKVKCGKGEDTLYG